MWQWSKPLSPLLGLSAGENCKYQCTYVIGRERESQRCWPMNLALAWRDNASSSGSRRKRTQQKTEETLCSLMRCKKRERPPKQFTYYTVRTVRFCSSFLSQVVQEEIRSGRSQRCHLVWPCTCLSLWRVEKWGDIIPRWRNGSRRLRGPAGI